MLVQKTARTTNYTTGRITAINATVHVGYGGGRVARFIDQIVTTNISAGGDSGSLVLLPVAITAEQHFPVEQRRSTEIKGIS